MRLLFVLLAMLGLAAAAPAQTRTAQAGGARDWRTVTTRTASGSFVTGNPAARVKLVEYASYVCGHCAAFSAQSAAVLHDRMVRNGSVSVELRHVVFNALDLGAAVLARCTGPRGIHATSAWLWATQGQWTAAGAQFGAANARRIGMYPPLAQTRALADGAGLTAGLTARGLTPAAVDACFADAAEVDRITGMAGAVQSTPTFLINGRSVGVLDWAQLEPKLRAAGAR
jgi:protein-disulfide isomerase